MFNKNIFTKATNFICFAILTLITSITYAGFQVSPVRLFLDKKEGEVTSLNFKNDTDKEKSFQVTVLKNISKDPRIEKPTKDLVVSPRIFRVAPGKGQLIRVALKNPKIDEKDLYFVSIKEVPQGEEADNQLKFITNMMIPVKVTSK